MTELLLRAVVDTVVDGIIFIDASGTVTMFNPACERMFGYPAAEIIGGNINRLMPEPYHAAHDGYLSDYRRTGERKIIGIRREMVARRQNGETFPIYLSVGETSVDGEPFYVGILKDITERHRATEQRERLIYQLAASNEETAHFAHVAAHDLREPLRMITAFCGLISNDYGERIEERGREYLALAIAGAVRMQSLLDDLVDYSNLGAEADRSVWFDAGDSIDHVRGHLHEAIRASGAEVTNGPMPRLYGNSIRFMRLLQNLVGNALKYVPADVAPRVHVAAHSEGDFWRFDVRDNGIGIDPRHFEQIFEPFKRLHSHSDYAGVGLGLAICRKIVGGFGGEICVRSAPGQGATFSFTVKNRKEGPADADDNR
jgi:two-component system sensor kinase FixL